jgi:hypothetical protein
MKENETNEKGFTMKRLFTIIVLFATLAVATLPSVKADNRAVASKGYGDNPRTFVLEQNYPNPFNPETNITYRLANSGQVRLSVYNLLGVEVAVLVDEFQSAGNYSIRFNAASLQSGVYLYKIKIGNQTLTRKMTYLK